MGHVRVYAAADLVVKRNDVSGQWSWETSTLARFVIGLHVVAAHVNYDKVIAGQICLSQG